MNWVFFSIFLQFDQGLVWIYILNFVAPPFSAFLIFLSIFSIFAVALLRFVSKVMLAVSLVEISIRNWIKNYFGINIFGLLIFCHFCIVCTSRTFLSELLLFCTRSMFYLKLSWAHLRRTLNQWRCARTPMGLLHNDALKQLTQSST